MVRRRKNNKTECPVCMDLKCSVKMLCNHSLCTQCFARVDKCPLCRQKIGNTTGPDVVEEELLPELEEGVSELRMMEEPRPSMEIPEFQRPSLSNLYRLSASGMVTIPLVPDTVILPSYSLNSRGNFSDLPEHLSLDDVRTAAILDQMLTSNFDDRMTDILSFYRGMMGDNTEEVF